MIIDSDALNYSCICTGKRYTFEVGEDGVVLRTLNSGVRESKAKVILINGRAFVYIGRLAYKLDTLVAKHFIPGYESNDVIEHLDGDPWNCAVWNLKIIPRARFNTGRSRNHLARPVAANGIIYPSIQAAAKALFVDTSTLHRYLRGDYKKSMLDGANVKYV